MRPAAVVGDSGGLIFTIGVLLGLAMSFGSAVGLDVSNVLAIAVLILPLGATWIAAGFASSRVFEDTSFLGFKLWRADDWELFQVLLPVALCSLACLLNLWSTFLAHFNVGRVMRSFVHDPNVPFAELQSLAAQGAPLYIANATVNDVIHPVDPRLTAVSPRDFGSFAFTPFTFGSQRIGLQDMRDRPDFTLKLGVGVSGAALSPNLGQFDKFPGAKLFLNLLQFNMGRWWGQPSVVR